MSFINRQPAPASWRGCPDCARTSYRCAAHCLVIEIVGEVVVVGTSMLIDGVAIVGGHMTPIYSERVFIPSPLYEMM